MKRIHPFRLAAARAFFFLLAIFLTDANVAAQAPGSIDTSFNPGDVGFGNGDGANDMVHTSLLQPDGKILIGGDFTAYNGTTRNRIARLNADGTLDNTFAPAQGANGEVNALAVQPDGKIIIGGSFTSYNGTTRNRIARLNADGTLDISFNPGTGANTYVLDIVVQPDGKIIVVGSFITYNGVGNNRIIRLTSTGTFDPGFNPGAGANDNISKAALQPDGKIVLGGSFTTFNGVSRNRIARLNDDGTLDTGFTPGTGANNHVYSIDLLANGKIAIGGSFTSFAGIARNRVALLNSNGTPDASFNPGTALPSFNANVYAIAAQPDGSIIAAGALSSSQAFILRLLDDGQQDLSFAITSAPNISVTSLNLQADGKIILGGGFTRVNTIGRNRIARLHTDGTPDLGFNTGSGSNNKVNAIEVLPDGKAVIVGSFSIINGISRNGIAILNADGTVHTGFDPGTGVNTEIFAVAVQTDGRIIIGGDFTEYNGTVTNRIARLNADGTLDASFTIGSGLTGAPYALALQPDGKILVGGGFTTFNGMSRPRLARLNANGTLDTGFNGTLSGPNGTVNEILLMPDGKMIIGGSFTSYNGTARNSIARVNADGSNDINFFPGAGANNVITDMALQPDGLIVICGAFTTYNSTARNRIARIYPNGNLDPGFNPGTGANNSVNSIAVQNNGKIIIGGDFSTYNYANRNRIARLTTTGSIDPDFTIGTGATAAIHAIRLQNDGKILIGGDFTSYNATGRNRVARLHADAVIPPTLTPGTLTSSVFCQGTTLSVPFTATGTFNAANNYFNVLLSDATGSFATATIIGTYYGSGPGTINATIPANAPPGNAYRIKLISSNPAIYSADNGTDLTINFQPDISVVASAPAICVGASSSLTASGATSYTWLPGNGFSGSNNADVVVTPVSAGIHTYTVTSTNLGCADTATITVASQLYCPDPGFLSGLVNGCVFASVVQPDGKIVIGGSFSMYNGVPQNNIARINPDGTLDTGFNVGSGPNGAVYALALYPDGKIVLGGSFTTVDGYNRNRILRLNSNGSFDGTFSIGSGANGAVYALALQPDGRILAGGSFTNYDFSAKNRIVRINADGSVDNSFSIGNGISGSSFPSVRSLIVQPDGKIIIAGSFSSYKSNSRSNIVRTTPSGDIDPAFTYVSGTNDGILSAVLQPDNKIVIGGDFTTYNGTTRNHIARLYLNGVPDAGFAGSGADNTVAALALQPNGKILIGGNFTTYDGESRNRITRVNTDGTLDTDFETGNGANETVYSISLLPDGKVMIAGCFTMYNDTPGNGLAKIAGEPAFAISVSGLAPQSYCRGSAISIPFTTSGNFSPGNVFTAQLSNAAGSFGAPFILGTLNGTTSGTINGVVPAGTPAGSGYRIRVVANNAHTASDNGSNISINSIPVVTATANPGTICEGQSIILLAGGAHNYSWSTGQTGSFITVSPVTLTSYTVTGTTLGCSATAVTQVAVTPRPVVSVTNASACQGTNTTFNPSAPPNATFAWTGPNGFTSAVRNPQLVNVSPAMAGNYTVIATRNGCSSLPAVLTLTLEQAPAASFTYQLSGCCTVTINNTSSGGQTYNYSFGDNSALSFIENPTHTYSSIGSFLIAQTVTGANGCSSYSSQTVSIITDAPDKLSSEISIYPNPTTGKFTLRISDSDSRQPVEITIMNLLGQSVFSRSFGGEEVTEIDMSGLPEGAYLVKALVDKKVMTQQIILQR